MEEIYIIGSGGFAKEVYFLIKEIKKYHFMGFVDKNPSDNFIKLKNEILPVIDEDFFLRNIKLTNVVFGIGNPITIEIFSKKYSNYNLPNIIHTSFVGDMTNILMGKGNVITAGVIFTTNIEIGSFNIFNINMTVGHDTKIGSCNVFNPSVNISGNCTIGDRNLFGVGSIILENKVVGDCNVIGASALLLSNIDDNCLYVGVPAKNKKNIN